MKKKGKKRKLKKNIKRLFITLIILMILSISIIISLILYNKLKINKNDLNISLNGEKNITLKWTDEEYNDQGATAKYKDKDLTKEIKITSDYVKTKVGEFKIKYKVEYKNIVKEVIRNIKVIDEVKPTIKLNGDSRIIVAQGQYKEQGATAKDDYDGDLTEKIEIDSSALNDKTGTYKIIYKVKDSSNNESSLEREVVVKELPKNTENQKVPVLNYHFFYKDENDRKKNCNQSICLDIKKFKEHLKYLNDNEFKILTIEEFIAWIYGELEIPEKSVLITIDDGAWGVSMEKGNYLIPALEEYKAHATLFLIVGWWETKNYQSPYLSIESHTWDLHHEYGHICKYRSKVNCVPYDDLVADLQRSVKVLKTNQAFCFPFYNWTEQSIRAVKEVGFKVAFIGGDRKASRKDNKYKIPRYPIQSNITMEEFKKMVN